MEPPHVGRGRRKEVSPVRVFDADAADVDMEEPVAEPNDVFSAGWGYSSTSLVSRAPTFVSSSSAFTDESSLQTPEIDSAPSTSQHGHGVDLDPHRTLRAAPIPMRPALHRRHSSAGSLHPGEEEKSASSSSSRLPISSSVPVRRPFFAPAAPFSNLVVVEDTPPPRPRRSSSRPRSRVAEQERFTPPALHKTVSITDPPAKKLKRKASLTVRGKYGGEEAPIPPFSPALSRPPLSASPASSCSVPPAPVPPRRSISARPSFAACRSPEPVNPLDVLPISLPPLPPPSSSSQPRRSRSKTKGAADGPSVVGKSSTLRGSLLNLRRKSTASLRNAFRSSTRDDTPPPSPPPLPALPPLARPALKARPAVARDTSVEQLISALEKADGAKATDLRRRASLKTQVAGGGGGRSRETSQQGLEEKEGKGEGEAGFSFSPTASTDPNFTPAPFSDLPRAPSTPPSPARLHRRAHSRPRPSTATTPSSPRGERAELSDGKAATSLRRVASTGTVKPRRPPPPLPALVARLEAKCEKSEARLA
ncbi:hypothetical protein JCM8547_009356 [Rhodosporidiobolus lusitaniae]